MGRCFLPPIRPVLPRKGLVRNIIERSIPLRTRTSFLPFVSIRSSNILPQRFFATFLSPGGDADSDSCNVQNFIKAWNETIVTYITDIEGDKAYLDRYVHRSRVLAFREKNSSTGGSNSSSSGNTYDDDDLPYDQYIDFTDPRALLVFGGDIWDKGGHDLYTIRQLNDLKRRYPDRVVFILGNRDVNKLRILQEIGLQEPPPPHPGLTWFKGTGRVGDPLSNLPSQSSVERLKWILGQTMGSPDAFSHRKQELEWEKTIRRRSDDDPIARTMTPVTDQDVVESYRQSCHPNGELGQFLSDAKFICRLGPLVFVHGSLPLIEEEVTKKYQRGLSVWDDLTALMPWIPKGETAQQHGVTTIDEWMIALNNFCHEKVEDWKADIIRIEKNDGIDDSVEPIWAHLAGYQDSYTDLVQYGMGMLPNRRKNPTVVYSTLTPGGMPHSFYPDSTEAYPIVQATKEFFDRASVQVLLAGHKPQGDIPSAIRVDESQWVILADTSYSSETTWHHYENDDGTSLSSSLSSEKRTNLGRGSSTSFRGEVAISEVLIHLGNFGSSLESLMYHGVLSDGTEYETLNFVHHDGQDTTTTTTTIIGQAAPDHLVPSEEDSPHEGRWWTKTIFKDGSILFYAGDGFHIWNLLLTNNNNNNKKKEAEKDSETTTTTTKTTLS